MLLSDHAVGIADKSLKIIPGFPQEVFQEINKMSNLSTTLLTDAAEALLHGDYNLADGTVDKVDAIRSLENEIILSVDKETKGLLVSLL